MLAMGLAMFLGARGSVVLVLLLAAAGLFLAGLARALGVREPGPWRARWLDLAVGAGFLLAAGLAVLWRTAPLRVLAWVLAGSLVLSGLAALGRGVLGARGNDGAAPRRDDGDESRMPSRAERASGVLGGLASVVVGVLVLVWPRLSLAVFAVVVGAWLVGTGSSLVLDALSRGRGESENRRGSGRRGGRRTWASVLRPSLALVLALALAAGTLALHGLDPRDEPDAFYTPPLAVPSEPGRLVRAEALPAERVPEGLRGWRILYTSTDGEDSPTVVSGTVLAPGATSPGALSTGALPVVSVAHGTTGIVPRCAPSLADEPFADGAGAALEQIVAEGWVGVTSDYVGLGTRGPHGYLVGPDAARNVLDATRAARKLDGLELSDQTVVGGHSQGGHGALWTGVEAPSYAPELEVLGVAAFAPAADLYPLAQGVRASVGGKLVSAYIAASWSSFYDLDLRSLVTPGYEGIVRRIEGHCFNGANVLGAFAIASQLTEEVFRPEVWDGEVVELLRSNTPDGDIAVPVLIAQGTADRLVLAEQQRDFVARRCAEGQAIDYREYEGLDHVPLVEEASPLTGELLDWTRDRLEGRPATLTC